MVVHALPETDPQADGYRRLACAIRSLVHEQSADAVLTRIATELRNVVRCDDVVIWELTKEERLIAIHVDGEDEEEVTGFEIAVGEGITGRAVLRQNSIVSNDAHLDQRAGIVPGTEPTPEAIVCIPLTARTAPLGALSVYRRGPDRAFGREEIELIEHFADVAAVALQNATTLAQLARLAATDDLTGLSNRRHFHQELQRYAASSQRHGSPLCLLLLDLDGFKEINDAYGHQHGDEVLRAVAETIGKRIRKSDLAGRLGGDEFAILLPHTTWDEGVTVAADLAASLEDSPNLPMKIRVSIGLTSASTASWQELLSRADQQLYVEKRARHAELAAVG
jgi:diguanylate cyclase (GGDEF)-like protein